MRGQEQALLKEAVTAVAAAVAVAVAAVVVVEALVHSFVAIITRLHAVMAYDLRQQQHHHQHPPPPSPPVQPLDDDLTRKLQPFLPSQET